MSSYSQLYPRIAGGHQLGGEIGDRTTFEPGCWYYEHVDDMDHIDIVALPELDQVGRQKTFYHDLFDRLASL